MPTKAPSFVRGAALFSWRFEKEQVLHNFLPVLTAVRILG